MDILEEIRHGFANLADSGRMLPIIALPTAAPAWIFTEDSLFGVAVELTDKQMVSESFAGARLITVDRIVNGATCRLLRLESTIHALRNEFAVVCAQLVTPGATGASRTALIENPLDWWERWRHLLGNAVVSQASYAVLGELLAVERLHARGERAEWRGPLGSTIDIVTPTAAYEVKSTLSRYDSRIHIAGQFQLGLFENRTVNLIHYRFEPTASGESVNSVIIRLIAAGFSSVQLEELLTRCGLEAGCSARHEKFTVLESRLFPVDETFPRITPSSFASGTLPRGIIHIAYQVDLSGLSYEPF